MKRIILLLLISILSAATASADVIADYAALGANGVKKPERHVITNRKASISPKPALDFSHVYCKIPAERGQKYTFIWERKSGTGYTSLVTQTNAAQGSFAYCGLPKQHNQVGQYRVRVTSRGQTVFLGTFELVW